MRTYWIACDAKGFAVPYAISYSKECAEIACTRYYNLPDEAWDEMAEQGYTVTEHEVLPAETLDKVREALQASADNCSEITLGDDQCGCVICQQVRAALALLDGTP